MDARRSIPAVEKLLGSASFAGLLERAPRDLVVTAIRHVQEEIRTFNIDASTLDEDWYASRTSIAVDHMRAPSLRRVINATGVVLHTNLGRAPLAKEAINAVANIAGGYNTLEYHAATGKRGSRYTHCASLFTQLTGAQDALVVNNNAAALVLALNTFSRNRTTIVSRGELVEIGGSFRVPDIMARSGARLLEVGSTNRTHLPDYADAIDERTALLMKVHQSNFSMAGYTAEVSLEKLVAVGRERSVDVIYDLGSGLLDHADRLGLPHEPTARGALRDGASIVTLSGDKLLGGPQAGVLLGSASHIAAMRKNPLLRAMRVDKLTIAALEATLILHLDPENARRRIPALRMITMTLDEMRTRAERVARLLQSGGCAAEIVDGDSSVGGGAAPGTTIPSVLLRITQPGLSATKLETFLRTAEIPVIARVAKDAVFFDLRTVAEEEEAQLAETIRSACTRASASAPRAKK